MGHPDVRMSGKEMLLLTPNILASICEILDQTEDTARMRNLFNALPDYPYVKYVLDQHEEILSARATVLFHDAKFKELYRILEMHHFSAKYHPKLQNLWLDAHYKEAEVVKGQPLCAVSKYRVRKKYPLPYTIWDGEAQTTRLFQKNTLSVLKDFYQSDPYPNLNKIKDLARATRLSPIQIRTWFKNRRQRDRIAAAAAVSSSSPSSSTSSLHNHLNDEHNSSSPNSEH
uniref:Six3/6b homeobox protein n=1 Tax=Xenoturbella bocki TaxID=242395 RepID=A0A2P1DV58_XENBC|nr:Six3/6b homeobox protein [Xenoturbella bocki]